MANLNLRPAEVSPKPLHTPYTVWADFTAKGSQFRQPWVVVTDQIIPVVLGMYFISRTGSRLLINGNLEQRIEERRQRRRRQQRQRWREENEGLGDSSTEEEVTYPDTRLYRAHPFDTRIMPCPVPFRYTAVLHYRIHLI